MIERGALGFLKVMKDGPGSADAFGHRPDAEPVEVGDAEMGRELVERVVLREVVVVEPGRTGAQGRGIGGLPRFRYKDLRRVELLDFLGERGGRDFSRRELAGRDVGEGDAVPVPGRRDRKQVVVAPGFEQVRVGYGPGRYDLDHVASDDRLSCVGRLELVADRDLEPLGHKSTHVGVERLGRDPGQRNPIVRAVRPRGQRQVERLGPDARVLVEQLVEIADPEQEQRVLVLFFYLSVLGE